ncbi:putative rerric reductase like transmembrane component [Daldinia decipiens]|uniref:putative rerric reductase like transmembrane component n=1 Tax=Daldinia decipiens TaxID=326647 RepID=UPI0020C256A4|nr:putative rerric reductase like transmembrane component [Daldinia decipiens]KAI1652928.1 putative rerric reductase like transmembrane component [Daldinia decipiens]
MKVILIITIIASLTAATSLGGHGFIGYGISIYDPICAYACRNVISFMTSDDCYATDDSFLRSFAYCISTHCFDTPLSDLEHYWTNFLIGRKPGQTSPKESYSITLTHIDPPPAVVVNPTSMLSQTTLVAEEDYLSEYDHVFSFQQVETRQTEFGIQCVANHMGILSFANFALLVLYAGRNNILLSITDWSYSTFLLLHRWVAIICTLEACMHASIYLNAYIAFGTFAAESKKTYWIWGIVAVSLMTILLPTSSLPLRRKFYSLFLTSHFIFALIALIGCYFHVYHRYMNQRGYETWVYIALAFWAFDRFMRFVRLARNGVRKAEVSIVDDDYIRLDIPNITGQGHAYLHFPTLTWLAWENHPFSVLGTMMADEIQKASSVATAGEDTSMPSGDIEKAPAQRPIASTTDAVDSDGSTSPQTTSQLFRPGLTFFINTAGKGLTAALRKKKTLPVLVEASYAATSLDELRMVPNCILIAGGVGISAMVPILRIRTGRMRLFWGMRNKSLAEAVTTFLGPDILVPNIIGEIAAGRRLNLRAILGREVVGDGETAVVVCGPNSMADETRAIVSELGRKSRVVKLVDEAFSW